MNGSDILTRNQIAKTISKIDNFIDSRISPDSKDDGARIRIDQIYCLVDNESDNLRVNKIQQELIEIRNQLTGS